MKENYGTFNLYPNEQVALAVGEYACNHSTKLPRHITDYHAWGVESQERANYMISPFQAQFHVWFAKALGAKRILEIGTFIGFSTLGWVEAVGPDGHVTALEFSSDYAKIAKETLVKNGIKNAEVIVGDARESIQQLITTLKEPYDLIFIDADKTSYPTYLSLILSLSPSSTAPTQVRLLKKDGIILADNVLRRGLIADSTEANPWSKMEKQKAERNWKDADKEALDQFNKALVNSERCDTFLMPLFDGLGMGRLVD